MKYGPNDQELQPDVEAAIRVSRRRMQLALLGMTALRRKYIDAVSTSGKADELLAAAREVHGMNRAALVEAITSRESA